MKVFISWSGPTSQSVAKALAEWVSDVLQGVECWYSPDDIEKGSMWFSEINQTLGENNVGILCITPDNMHAPWIHFEAGALFKGLSKARVCPLLLGGLAPSDITAPLSHFNLTVPEEQDMLRLLRTINAANEKPLDDDRLEKAFLRWWPDFRVRYEATIKDAPKPMTQKRSTPDLLSEILEGVRHIQRSLPPTRAVEEGNTFAAGGFSGRLPAVATAQEFGGGSEALQTGILRISVLRQTFTATGSGKLIPPMREKPWVTVQLLSAPPEYRGNSVKFTCGTGTTFDFNITLKATEYGVSIPPGEYVFSYEARVREYGSEEPPPGTVEKP